MVEMSTIASKHYVVIVQRCANLDHQQTRANHRQTGVRWLGLIWRGPSYLLWTKYRFKVDFIRFRTLSNLHAASARRRPISSIVADTWTAFTSMLSINADTSFCSKSMIRLV
jgi:hypothetical protein